MQPCAIQRCTLRPEFVNLSLADQAAMVLACKIADDHAFAKCSEKQRALAEWIDKQ